MCLFPVYSGGLQIACVILALLLFFLFQILSYSSLPAKAVDFSRNKLVRMGSRGREKEKKRETDSLFLEEAEKEN
jgi:hypothetical protein